jgi:hypothetical protein
MQSVRQESILLAALDGTSPLAILHDIILKVNTLNYCFFAVLPFQTGVKSRFPARLRQAWN